MDEVLRRSVQDLVGSVDARRLSAAARAREDEVLGHQQPVLVEEDEDLHRSAQDERLSARVLGGREEALRSLERTVVVSAAVVSRRHEGVGRFDTVVVHSAQVRLLEAQVFVLSAGALDLTAQDRSREAKERGKRTQVVSRPSPFKAMTNDARFPWPSAMRIVATILGRFRTASLFVKEASLR